MSTNFNFRTPNDFLHGDEHICFGDCARNKNISCICEQEMQEAYDRMAEDFQDWLIQEGQA